MWKTLKGNYNNNQNLKNRSHYILKGPQININIIYPPSKSFLDYIFVIEFLIKNLIYKIQCLNCTSRGYQPDSLTHLGKDEALHIQTSQYKCSNPIVSIVNRLWMNLYYTIEKILKSEATVCYLYVLCLSNKTKTYYCSIMVKTIKKNKQNKLLFRKRWIATSYILFSITKSVVDNFNRNNRNYSIDMSQDMRLFYDICCI